MKIFFKVIKSKVKKGVSVYFIYTNLPEMLEWYTSNREIKLYIKFGEKLYIVFHLIFTYQEKCLKGEGEGNFFDNQMNFKMLLCSFVIQDSIPSWPLCLHHIRYIDYYVI